MVNLYPNISEDMAVRGILGLQVVILFKCSWTIVFYHLMLLW